MKTQSGFTLIELVLVIAILGILAAVAVPQFVDLTDNADQAAVSATAGAAASASALNFASDMAGNAYTTLSLTGGQTCDNVSGLLAGSAWPTGTTASATAFTDTLGQAVTCTLTTARGNTADFQALSTP